MPQTHSREVDYSLFYHGAGVGDVREAREATGGNSDNISPSNLHRYNLCFVVLCFSTASTREHIGGGGIYIGLFRLRQSIWSKDG
jgi:hypothetical protein